MVMLFVIAVISFAAGAVLFAKFGRSPADRVQLVLLSLAYAGSFPAWAWLVTYGTGELLQPEFFGEAYDSLARHLLQGSAEIDRAALLWEAYRLDGRTVMYFGPFPVLLRIVLNALWPKLYGNWCHLSILVGAICAWWGAVFFFHEQLEENAQLSPRGRRLLLSGSALCFGLATPVVFLASNAMIYHEAIIWGLCFAIWSLFFWRRFSTAREEAPGVLLGVAAAAGFALLSRLTFAVPFYLLIAVSGVALLKRKLSEAKGASQLLSLPADRNVRRFVLLCLPAIAAGAAQLWYNEARFGSPFTLMPLQSYQAKIDDRGSTIKQIGGQLNGHRLPVALKYYFGIPDGLLSPSLPFVRMTAVSGEPSPYYPDKYRSGGALMNVVPLTVSAAWLIAGALLGLFFLARSSPRGLTVLLAFLPQLLIVLGYYWICERYAAEFVPVLLLLYGEFLRRWAPGKRRGAPAVAAAALLACASIAATLGSTADYLQHKHWEKTEGQRETLNRVFGRMNEAVGLRSAPERAGREEAAPHRVGGNGAY